MAENEDKKDKQPPPTNKLDRLLSKIESGMQGVETTLDKVAGGEVGIFKKLGLFGDKNIKDKVDAIGLDRAMETFVKIPGTLIASPFILRAAIGTELGANWYARQRFRAEQYKKGSGPWVRKAERNIGEDAPTAAQEYSAAYASHRSNGIKRKEEFKRLKQEKQADIKTARASGNRLDELRARRELRTLKRKYKNPTLSRGAATPDELDNLNVARVGTGVVPAGGAAPDLGLEGGLTTKRGAYTAGVPPIFRRLKARGLERDTVKVEKRKQRVNKILSYGYGTGRIAQFREKRATAMSNLKTLKGQIPPADPADIKAAEADLKKLDWMGRDRAMFHLFGQWAA